MQNEMEREERSALKERCKNWKKEKSRKTNMDFFLGHSVCECCFIRLYPTTRVHGQLTVKNRSQNEGINKNHIRMS